MTCLVLARVFAVVRGSPGLTGVELSRVQPRLLPSLLEVIRETELSGGRVLRVAAAGRPSEQVLAVDLMLRLRALAPALTEEELLSLLELLPI